MITVIVPVYNVEEFVDECLESLAEQSIKEFEVIVVNDGSTDGSLAKVHRWSTRIGNLKVLSKENGGLSSARNAGLLEATGDYILFLDSDDCLDRQALQTLENKVLDQDCDIVLFSAKTFGPLRDVAKGSYIRSASGWSANPSGTEFLKWCFDNKKYVPSACLYLFKRSILGGLRFVEGALHEDNHFTPLLLLNANEVAILEDALYLRRMRAGSITTAEVGEKNVLGYLAVAHELRRCASEETSENSELLRLAAAQSVWRSISVSLDIKSFLLRNKMKLKAMSNIDTVVVRCYGIKILLAITLPSVILIGRRFRGALNNR